MLQKRSKPPTLDGFVRQFGDTWLSIATGGLSFPFAFAGILLGETWAKVLFGVLSFVSLYTACYLVWAKERNRVCDLEESVSDIDRRASERTQLAAILDEFGVLQRKIEDGKNADESLGRDYERLWATLTSFLRAVDPVEITQITTAPLAGAGIAGIQMHLSRTDVLVRTNTCIREIHRLLDRLR